MKAEFQFFKDLSKIGVDLISMMQHLSFMRSLEVKTLCHEGYNQDSGQVYIVFSGQCEVYKTRNEFKAYDDHGFEVNMSEPGFIGDMN